MVSDIIKFAVCFASLLKGKNVLCHAQHEVSWVMALDMLLERLKQSANSHIQGIRYEFWSGYILEGLKCACCNSWWGYRRRHASAAYDRGNLQHTGPDRHMGSVKKRTLLRSNFSHSDSLAWISASTLLSEKWKHEWIKMPGKTWLLLQPRTNQPHHVLLK